MINEPIIKEINDEMKLIRNIALSLILLSAVEASADIVEQSLESLTRAGKQINFLKEQHLSAVEASCPESLTRAEQEAKFIEAQNLYTTYLHLYRKGPCVGDINRRLLRFSNMYNALKNLQTISLQEGNPFAKEANNILSEYKSNKDRYKSGWENYNQALLA